MTLYSILSVSFPFFADIDYLPSLLEAFSLYSTLPLFFHLAEMSSYA